MARKAVFGLLATGLFFGLLELVLLLGGVEPVLQRDDPYVGFSSKIPLFVEEAGGADGPWMATAQNKLLLFNRQRFRREKDERAFRIFCLGGSTAFGHPYEDSTSFCGWLRELLPVADPSRSWELINAAGISYASYREALLMEELVRYEPDLFVVLTGHNEFLERRTYAGMRDSSPLVRDLDLWLSHSRTYSLIARAVRGRAPSAKLEQERDLLPAEVDALLDHSVGPEDYHRDDELAANVTAHFRFNVSRMIGIARSVGAELLLVAPASNLADCSPFKSEPAPPSRDAAAHYQRGRALIASGREAEARDAFRRARDEDVCPLRATTAISAAVREVAAEQDAPWIDFESLVARRAPSGIPGRESFLDHVHPTIEVNRLLALEILDWMSDAGIVRLAPGWGDAAVRRVTGEVEGRIDRLAHAMALRNLANVLAWAGKLEEAGRLAEQATELAPEEATTHNQLGITLAERGDSAGAEEQFRLALGIDPGLSLAHNNLGVILEGRGELEAASEHYRRAVEARPDYVEALNNLGVVSLRLGRLDQAERALESALAVNPDHVRALANMATLAVASGDREGAVRQLERALRIDPTSVEVHNNLGIVLYELGRLAPAQEHFAEAIRLDPTDPEGFNNLGVTYEREGDVARALAEYERAVAVAPAHAAARANIARLRGAPSE